MATGALDANGIWQYGEDDSEPTFSGLLNKLGESTSDTVTRLENLTGLNSAQYETHRANLGVGFVPMNPTVSVAGGTFSKSTVGTVTFTTCTSISLNNVFTSEFSAYRVVLQITGHSASSASFMRLRSASTDNSAAQYTTAFTVITPTTTVRIYSAAQTAAEVEYGVSGFIGAHAYDIVNPQITGHTAVTRMSTYVGAGGTETATGGFYHNVSASYDGFTIYPGSGNISGRITVYGLND